MANEQCDNHTFEQAEAYCGQCARPYCPECLIYAFGPKKPPLCKSCAIARAGIRKHAGPAPASKRDLKRVAREHRRQLKEKQKTKVESAPSVSADMDWSALDAEEPGRPQYRDQGSAVVSGMAVGLGFSDEPELHEIRPAFDGRLAQAPG